MHTQPEARHLIAVVTEYDGHDDRWTVDHRDLYRHQLAQAFRPEHGPGDIALLLLFLAAHSGPHVGHALTATARALALDWATDIQVAGLGEEIQLLEAALQPDDDGQG